MEWTRIRFQVKSLRTGHRGAFSKVKVGHIGDKCLRRAFFVFHFICRPGHLLFSHIPQCGGWICGTSQAFNLCAYQRRERRRQNIRAIRGEEKAGRPCLRPSLSSSKIGRPGLLRSHFYLSVINAYIPGYNRTVGGLNRFFAKSFAAWACQGRKHLAGLSAYKAFPSPF